MAQVKIFGLEKTLTGKRDTLSGAIHGALMTALELPAEKKFQRYIPLDTENFLYPDDRSGHYIIIEISMFAGRSEAAKKALINQLFANIEQQCGIQPQDVEITLFETPMANWGIRGLPADELSLNYQVKV